MPARPEPTGRRPRILSVPLFLIPKVIQEEIKKKGPSVFRIFVERRRLHQYRVRVDTSFEHSRRVRKGTAKKPESTVQDVLDV
jgi:hypothetical protein